MSILYAITDSQLLPGDKLFAGVEAALHGGCKWIQYRDKSGVKKKRLHDAKKLVDLCNRYDAALIVNDDVQLAAAVAAQGVHLGQGDGDPRKARAVLGEKAIIGVTCHDSLELAEQAIQQGASYIAFGRFFPSRTKPNARPAKFTLISEAKGRFPAVPLVVIGGITLENAQILMDAGADKIAVCHELFSASDIRQTAELFNALRCD